MILLGIVLRNVYLPFQTSLEPNLITRFPLTFWLEIGNEIISIGWMTLNPLRSHRGCFAHLKVSKGNSKYQLKVKQERKKFIDINVWKSGKHLQSRTYFPSFTRKSSEPSKGFLCVIRENPLIINFRESLRKLEC